MHFKDDVEVTHPSINLISDVLGFISKDVPWFTPFSFYQLDFDF